jgi:hypothetical protein
MPKRRGDADRAARVLAVTSITVASASSIASSTLRAPS